jgi:zinc and cadmium transporter
MTAFAWLAAYSVAILFVSLVGGHIPLMTRVTHFRLQVYLSLSAGVMLGASFFHVMPDAMKDAGDSFGWWMALGVVGLFCIERFIAPHSHELAGPTAAKKDLHEHHDHAHEHHHDHGHAHPHEHHHDHAHEHAHEHAHGHSHGHVAAPTIAGWMAVLGLTIHTFMNGVGLAGAVEFDTHGVAKAAAALPGLALFLAIALHKPADALAISTVLVRKGVGTRKLMLVQLGFALMVPVGAAAFYYLKGHIDEGLQRQVTGAALAFSAGTFLFIALSDLLPEVQFHRHDRIPLFLCLLAGVLLMGGIAVLEDMGKQEHEDAPAVQAAGEGHDHPGGANGEK